MLRDAALELDYLEASAAKVGNKACGLGNVQGQALRYEMRLLILAQNLDRLADNGFGRAGEFNCVASAPHRRRGNGMDGGHPHRLHDACKTCHRGERHLDAIRLQHPVFAEPLS